MNTAPLVAWMEERHRIYLRRRSGLPRPWTEDRIMQEFKFCNVFRELDRVTLWIRDNWREPHASNPNIWMAMCIARQINLPDTLEEINFPEHDFEWEQVLQVLHDRHKAGKQRYTGAYMITAAHMEIRKGLCTKDRFMAEYVLGDLWADRDALMDVPRTLQGFHAWLCQHKGWGSFIAAQVVADLKYTPFLEKAPDWWTWAASGPGSKRGLNRLLGLPVKTHRSEADWLEKVQELNGLIPDCLGERLHMQDMQSTLCEFDKYERVRLGEGTPRSRFDGGQQ